MKSIPAPINLYEIYPSSNYNPVKNVSHQMKQALFPLWKSTWKWLQWQKRVS